jgi:glycosyltransferase involved in cell wall biosynthesis
VKPQRIWLAPSAFAPHKGGVEELTAQLGRELQARGHDVLIVTNRWPRDLAESERIEGIDVMRLPFTLPARRPTSFVEHARVRSSSQRALRELPRPDLIHVQCASSQTAFMRHYAKEADIPLVLTTQGETAMDAQGIYQRNPWLRRSFRRSALEARGLTACSDWTRLHAATIAPVFAHAEVVLNAVTPNDWTVAPAVTAPVFAAWGRHVHQKGFDLLLSAFHLVRRVRPEARLLLGGSGPLTASLAASGGRGVELVGPLDRGGVNGLLARSRVAVVPSRIEPFGIVALEALACGRGLVYSTRGGLGEAAGECGRPADPFDPGELAAAMLEEVEAPTDPELGRARAESMSWPRVADQYLTVYETALKGR